MLTKKLNKLLILTMFVLTILQAEIILGENRGVILSNDNKTVAANTIKECRLYPYNDMLEPLLGYSKTYLSKARGLEKSMNAQLVENKGVQLTIDLSLQQRIEKILDESKEILDADDVIAAIMESSTGNIIAMASSNRYDPNNLREKDIPFLSQKFSAYPYEPGSIMKPFVLALAMDKGVVKPDTVLNTYGGRFDIGEGRFIADSEKFNTLSATDIIVYASNIGITQISWLLSGYELCSGLKQFGFLAPSGIELTDDKRGVFRLEKDLERKDYRASTAYGYGMLVTFAQLLKAYNAFNNKGKVVTPQLVATTGQNNIHQAITPNTAKEIHDILVENVRRGTGINAQVKGVEIGGKTATAYIFKNGQYKKEYHSSFYGFANDSVGHTYTIGVLSVRPKLESDYLASKSAVTVFRKIVLTLQRENFLKNNIQKGGNYEYHTKTSSDKN